MNVKQSSNSMSRVGQEVKSDPKALAAQAIRLANKATPAPWEQFNVYGNTYIGGGTDDCYENGLKWIMEMCDSEDSGNSELVVFARNNIKAMAVALLESVKESERHRLNAESSAKDRKFWHEELVKAQQCIAGLKKQELA